MTDNTDKLAEMLSLPTFDEQYDAIKAWFKTTPGEAHTDPRLVVWLRDNMQDIFRREGLRG